MDADLQDDPKEFPRFLKAVDDGSLDVVSGWKRIRHDPWHKTLPSRVFNWMVSRLTGVRLHDHNCGFKCYRREIFNEVKLYGERHRFVRPLLVSARTVLCRFVAQRFVFCVFVWPSFWVFWGPFGVLLDPLWGPFWGSRGAWGPAGRLFGGLLGALPPPLGVF